ncbi:MAG: vitamin K epoxide reductase family protein [Candidatus Eremiobacter antarcticus]|nr:vitamin K epoxide reductase family protein [Candidatus Eremiobacteraeota bacterium]MBC5809092.1 vitamin K epoxide reductase family protein [Candidatus Eremiobacteraeota bacterium]
MIAALCLAGLYVSIHMLAKQRAAQRGELTEPSVVQTPRARVAGFSNALFGIAYYSLMLVAAALLQAPLVAAAALAAACLAAAFSLYLAYSLLFVTRMSCAYCWTGHVINWLLLAALIVRRAAL